MKHCGLIAIMVFTLFSSLPGQDSDIVFSGDFDSITFVQFVREMEDLSGVSFYYLEEWTKDIIVHASGKGLSLTSILEHTLNPKGISFIIIDEDQVYLKNIGNFITTLPDYHKLIYDLSQTGISEDYSKLTQTAQKYVEGRKTRIIDTLTIGSAGNGVNSGSAVINGRVLDSQTGESVVGATIYFPNLRKGTVTDLDGLFTIVVPTGKYSAEIKCMGMEAKSFFVEVISGGSIQIELLRSIIPIAEVQTQAFRYRSIYGMDMGVNRLNYQVIKEVPTMMGEKDLMKIIQLLPGVQSMGEGTAGYNVRGSAHDQNMIFINKVPLYNSSHLFGFFNSFNSDIIKDFTLLKGNFPASYGGRIGSYMDITTRQGNYNKFGARGGLSPVTGHLTLESPIQKGKSSLLISARTSYADWVLKHIEVPAWEDWQTPLLEKLEIPILQESKAKFYDLTGSFTWEPGAKTIIKFFGYHSQDRFILRKTNDYDYSNLAGSLDIRHRIGSRMNLNLTGIYSNYQFHIANREITSYAYKQDYMISHYEIKADMSLLAIGEQNLRWGVNTIFYDLDRGSIVPEGPLSLRVPVDLELDRGLETAVYLSDEISIFRWFTLYGGIRYVVYKSLGPRDILIYEKGKPYQTRFVKDTISFSNDEVCKTYSSIEPRLAISFLFGQNQSLKFSYNQAGQYIFMLTNTFAISPADQWKLCDYHHKPMSLEQYSMGYYLNIPRGDLNLSLELYQKKIANVLEYKDGASFISSPHVEIQTVPGLLEAYGLEVMFRKGTGKLSGWLAYSYSRSLMQVSSQFPGESINNGVPFPSNYDRPHNFSLVYNYKHGRRFSISSNVVYITGRPATYPVSTFFMDQIQVVRYSNRNQYRIPDYFRIDLSFNIEGTLKKKKFIHSSWMLNIYNLTGRRNAYSVFFNLDDGYIRAYKLSIFSRPVITLSWNFKMGNYATE